MDADDADTGKAQLAALGATPGGTMTRVVVAPVDPGWCFTSLSDQYPGEVASRGSLVIFWHCNAGGHDYVVTVDGQEALRGNGTKALACALADVVFRYAR